MINNYQQRLATALSGPQQPQNRMQPQIQPQQNQYGILGMTQPQQMSNGVAMRQPQSELQRQYGSLGMGQQGYMGMGGWQNANGGEYGMGNMNKGSM